MIHQQRVVGELRRQLMVCQLKRPRLNPGGNGTLRLCRLRDDWRSPLNGYRHSKLRTLTVSRTWRYHLNATHALSYTSA